MRPTFRQIRRLRPLILNPLTMAVLLLLTAVEVERIRGYSTLWQRSSLALLLRWEDLPSLEALASQRTLFIVRAGDDDGQWRLLEPDRESWDEASRVLSEHPEMVITAVYTRSSFERGLIHPTWQINSHILETRVEFGGEFTQAELAAARGAVLEHLNVDVGVRSDLILADAAGEAGVHSANILLRGYLLNIWLVVLVAGFAYSLWWIPAAIQRVRHWQRRRATARGLCPRCGYSMSGAESEICPECGSSQGQPAPRC